MRFTKIPKRPTDHVSNEELFHDLILLLKDIVAFESTLAKTFPENSNGNGHSSGNGNGKGHHLSESELASLTTVVHKITELNHRINKRSLNIDDVLLDASKQVGIDLRRLLEDSLRFPSVIPYARNLKGQRRLFLCSCGEKEAYDGHGLGLCTDCLEAALECVTTKKKDNKFILYSSYSPQVRCRHADFSTLLVTFNKPGLWPAAWCEICLKQEKQRLSN
jgi:hypothetical protein